MRPLYHLLLKGTEYHHCCHSNLTRALATERSLPLEEAVEEAFRPEVPIGGRYDLLDLIIAGCKRIDPKMNPEGRSGLFIAIDTNRDIMLLLTL